MVDAIARELQRRWDQVVTRLGGTPLVVPCGKGGAQTPGMCWVARRRRARRTAAKGPVSFARSVDHGLGTLQDDGAYPRSGRGRRSRFAGATAASSIRPRPGACAGSTTGVSALRASPQVAAVAWGSSSTTSTDRPSAAAAHTMARQSVLARAPFCAITQTTFVLDGLSVWRKTAGLRGDAGTHNGEARTGPLKSTRGGTRGRPS